MDKKTKKNPVGRPELGDGEKLQTVRVGIKTSIIEKFGEKELQAEFKRHSETLDLTGKRKKTKK